MVSGRNTGKKCAEVCNLIGIRSESVENKGKSITKKKEQINEFPDRIGIHRCLGSKISNRDGSQRVENVGDKEWNNQ